MDKFDIDQLSISEIGLWPVGVRYVIFLVAMILFPLIFYYFFIFNISDETQSALAKQLSLKQEFRTKNSQARNFALYSEELKQIQSSIRSLLKKFPNKNELPLVIKELSQQALISNVKDETISPKEEVRGQNYNHQNIDLSLEGQYHNFGNFLSGISKLQRLITTHDFSIEPTSAGNSGSEMGQSSSGDQNSLQMKISARSYWDVGAQ